MIGVGRRFLPDRFRPRTPRRRRRGPTMLPLLVLAAGLLAVPSWTVRSVEVRGAELVPAAVDESLHGLTGHLVPTLDLGWLHRVAESWPAAHEVRVRLELPGTVVVEIFPEPVRGSAPVGGGWHSVAADGRLAGPLDGPETPRLLGFQRPADRRRGFAVARRLERACGAEIIELEQVTPSDYRVDLRLTAGDRAASVHVLPDGTEAEAAWCGMVTEGGVAAVWADLRWPHRMVVRTDDGRGPVDRDDGNHPKEAV